MRLPTEIPEALADFARTTTGGYAERYDQILEEAFARHQILPPAAVLRTLAGGGSGTTAQEAVARFRLKLHKALAAKIEFGPEIPPSVATKLSAAAGEIWAESSRLARDDLRAHQERADQAVRDAHARELDAQRAAAEQAAMVQELEARVVDLEAERRSLVGHVEELRSQLQQTASRADVAAQEARDLRAHVQALGAEIERARADGQRAVKEAQAAADDARRGLLQQLDHVRTQAKEDARNWRADLDAASKERERLVAQASGRETQLAILGERLNVSTSALATLEAQAVELRSSLSSKDAVIAQLTEAAQRTAQTVMELRQDLDRAQRVLAKAQSWAQKASGSREALQALLRGDGE